MSEKGTVFNLECEFKILLGAFSLSAFHSLLVSFSESIIINYTSMTPVMPLLQSLIPGGKQKQKQKKTIPLFHSEYISLVKLFFCLTPGDEPTMVERKKAYICVTISWTTMECKRQNNPQKLKLRKEERALNGHHATMCPFSEIELLREICHSFKDTQTKRIYI